MPTLQQLKAQILAEKANQEALQGIDSTSNAAIYNLWAYVVAFVMWSLYNFFELYKTETDEKIAAQKKYTLRWYRAQALAFRNGQSLEDESDTYSDEGLTAEQIAESKIITRASVNELELTGRKNLFIKIAQNGENGALAKIPEEIRKAVEQYFARIKAAGTKIVIFTGPADDLQLSIRFFYNPLVLDQNGARVDGSSNTPVQDTIRYYLANLKFNGEFNLAALIDLLQDVDGCADREVYIDEASANYLTPPDFQPIESSYVANSGYMQITDENLNIEFIAKTVQL